jgi:hypothetical protein
MRPVPKQKVNEFQAKFSFLCFYQLPFRIVSPLLSLSSSRSQTKAESSTYTVAIRRM